MLFYTIGVRLGIFRSLEQILSIAWKINVTPCTDPVWKMCSVRPPV